MKLPFALLNRVYWAKQRALLALFPNAVAQDIPELCTLTRTLPPGKRIGHVAMYSDGNAGDSLLPRTVRDAIDKDLANEWQGVHAHRVVNHRLLNEINKLDGLLIGGGGLFLRDTNPNNLSGWQWSCSTQALEQINVPIALFAVGYNRFRGQNDFKPIFRRHLEILADKCVFMGLRNYGSIEAIKTYLPQSLHHKVRFQPCPTTICKHLYPTICSSEASQPTIALNCAFDRIDLRLGENKDKILFQLSEVAKELSQHAKIVYYSHAKSDERMLPYLDKNSVPYELTKLYYVTPREVIDAYSQISLAIGMRGHAQMIPFGCGTPIISLISHDKVRWFLDDIQRPDWGEEMENPKFKESLKNKALHILGKQQDTRDDINTIQETLKKITFNNASEFIHSLGKQPIS